MRILVAEDEKRLCGMLVQSLRQAGYEVDTCHDGAEALEQAQAERYDLVVLDLTLPGMDGMTLLKTLRRDDAETKVLILSARDQTADKVRWLDAGANDYLAKPFHFAELEARVRSLTRKETGILEYLLHNQGRPVSQEELIGHVWDGSVDSFSNSIRVHMSSLRRKLKAALGCDPIRNRIGEGYVIGGDEA